MEVERSHGDAGKPDIYRDLGVAEMWRIDMPRPGSFAVEILDLQRPGGVEAIDRSALLPGLTPVLITRTLQAARRRGYRVIPELLAAAGMERTSRPGSAGPGF